MKVKVVYVLALVAVFAMVLSACTAPAGSTTAPAAPGGETAAVGGDIQEDYTTPHPILSDIRVRQAIAHCIDRDALIASVYPYVSDDVKPTLRMDTFLPKTHWAYSGPYTDYPYDPDAGDGALGRSRLDNARRRQHPPKRRRRYPCRSS